MFALALKGMKHSNVFKFYVKWEACQENGKQNEFRAG